MPDENQPQSDTQIEHEKKETILHREKGYTYLIAMACVAATAAAVLAVVGTYALIGYIIPAFRAWKDQSQRQAEKVDQTTTAVLRIVNRADGIMAKLDKSADKVDTILANSNLLVSDQRGNLNRLSNDLHGELVQVKSLTAELQHQLKQNGDELAGNQKRVGKLIDDVAPHITNAAVHLDKATGNLEVATDDAHLQAILDHADRVVIDMDGSVRAIQPVEQNMAGITGHLNGLTGDVEKWTHDHLFPPPEHGVRGWLKKYLLRPIKAGAGVGYLVLQVTGRP